MRLARESRSDDAHLSTPGSPVEGLDVVPKGSFVKVSVCDSLVDDPLAVGVILNVADGSDIDTSESKSKGEPSVTAEETDFGNRTHI